MQSGKRKNAKILALLLLVITVLGSAFYLNDHYPADLERIGKFATATMVDVAENEVGYTLAPENAQRGFIFYPGGKVDHEAYLPLMRELASEGVLCVVAEMPFRLAVLDMDAAAGIPEQYPRIESWYIGGHSLGGAMAASWLAKNTDTFDGLILLGAYSTADLSGTDLAVLSIYGSEDLVMNREKYQANLGNLPSGFTEVIIDGGCHAGFGMYGVQNGDGIATISSEDQIRLTAKAILDLMEK